MPFRNVPLKRKLVGIILLTSMLVLFLTCIMLFYYEVRSYRKTVTRNLSSLADIIAANSASVLIFDDQTLAQKILAGLQVEPEIEAAAFYDEDGQLYATYSASAKSATNFATSPEPDGIRIQGSYLKLYEPIVQENRRVGTLYLEGDLNLTPHLKIYGLVLLTILVASGIIAFFLSNVFQRQISEPLLNLAAVAAAVSERKDYSVRAKKVGNDELGYLTDAFNFMLSRIQASHNETLAALRAKDDFLAALSHELRTPLNPVLLVASDAAANPDLSAATRADFEMIRRNVELEARLIDDLLDLTRITRGKLSLDLRLLDVHFVLKEAVSTVRAEAEIKNIEIELDLRAEDPSVYGDAVRLQQVFWNVLKNAVKFTPDSGKVAVKTFAGDGSLFIKVIDTGIGLKPAELERVFDAFSQGEHADGMTHRFGGLGLGLAISRRLIELHSGSIHASSSGPGTGSTFTIQLPLMRSEQNAGAKITAGSAAAAKLSSTTTLTKRPRRILLVEDHEQTRTVLMQLLVRRHYDVVPAGSVAQARAEADNGSRKFDLVISDIGLPDGNGYDLMNELREKFNLKGIALTGYGMERDVARSQSSGFIAHLTKPVRMETLDNALASAFAPDK